MMEAQYSSPNTYELIENDDGEIMVLIYAGDTAPKKPTFCIDESKYLLEIYRSSQDIVNIVGLLPETLEKIKQLTTIYVCEMKYNEDPNAESEIIYAYSAKLKKKSSQQNQNETTSQNKQTVLAEKARQARENILNQNKTDKK